MVNVKFIRHSFKSKATNPKLTPAMVIALRKRGKLVNTSLSVKGRRAAFEEGKVHGFETTGRFSNSPGNDSKTKMYAGTLGNDSVRTRATAEAVKRGIQRVSGTKVGRKYVGGNVYGKIRYRKGLAFEEQVIDLKRLYEVLEKNYGGSEEKALRAYLDGNTLEGTLVPIKKVVKRFTRRLAVGIRYELMKKRAVQRMKAEGATEDQVKAFLRSKKANMLNFSHSWGLDGLVEALSGRKIESYSPPGVIRELEGVHFTVNPEKIMMFYRGNPVDVTKTLEKKYPSVLRGVFSIKKIKKGMKERGEGKPIKLKKIMEGRPIPPKGDPIPAPRAFNRQLSRTGK